MVCTCQATNADQHEPVRLVRQVSATAGLTPFIKKKIKLTMTFLSSLSMEDLGRYSSLMAEALRVRRHVDLLLWLQGGVQHFLPHEIMLAAWGDFGLGLVHHDIISILPGVRTEQLDDKALAPLLLRLFNRWVELGKAPYTVGAGETGFLLADSSLQCALGHALKGMRSSLVHGISDERGRHDCLYVTFSSRPEPEHSTRQAMNFLLPYLDAAMRQVAHLPNQFSAGPSGPMPERHEAESQGLSDREIEIMVWVRMGKTNAEIGSILDISAFTVKNHLQRIFKKLDVFNRVQAASKFKREHGVTNA